LSANTQFADTDLCVKCGLCLPYCPTYTLTKNENESPRGRLALIQGWSEGQLEATNKLTQYIDNCLTCRACERMCPAQVPYAQLVNNFRSETASSNNKKLNWIERFSINYLTGQHRKGLNSLLRCYQKMGLNKLPLRLNSYLPKKVFANHLNETYPSLALKKQGHVALFTGCATEIVDSKTLKDSLFLLQHCGFDITIPKNQSCCGAIDLHAGNKARAFELAQNNQLAFSSNDYDAIITVASGCGATLAEYDSYIAPKTTDINDFIAPYLSALTFNPLAASAWLHTPCTLKNVQSKGTDISVALSAIGELDIKQFDDNQHCCGSAGKYMLTHKETADALREKTLAPLKKQPTNYLLSSNIGCAMHLRAGLKQAGLNTEVLHPVSLLAQQLKV
jgi:glycolate oxidase iron-sulfur subunit